MRKVAVSFVLSFFSLLSYSWASQFDPDYRWGEMHYFAKSRADWHQDTCQKLANKKIDLEDRLKLAKKINPDFDELGVKVNAHLSVAAQKQLQKTKVVEIVLSDLTYSFLYWQFIAQTLDSYCTGAHKNPEQRMAVLPHLVKELINFDTFAVEDLKIDSQRKYYIQELFTGRAIIEECEALAIHYGIVIDHPMQVVDTETQEPVSLSEMQAPNTILIAPDEVEDLATDSPYFMEQLMIYRKACGKASAKAVPVPDLNSDANLKLFQAYILPSTGSSLIDTLKRKFIEVLPDPVKKNQPVAKPKLKKKKKKKVKFHGDKPTKKVIISAETAQTKVDEVISSTTPAAASASVSIPAAAPAPSAASALISVQRLNIRDIKLRIEERDCRDYLFQGNRFSLPFFAQSLKRYDLHFLKEVKRLTYHAPKTDKLPNLLQGCLTFHLQVGEQNVAKTVIFDELFLSGGKVFLRDGLDFKERNNIVNASHDFMSEKDKLAMRVLPNDKKGFVVGIAMEKKLRSQIVMGPWRKNCLDSEAIFLLFLLKKLPNILDRIVAEHPKHQILVQAAIIGLSTYKDCCPNCEQVIQGFQWGFRDAILEAKRPRVLVDDNFATLAITLGQTRLPNREWEMPRKYISGPTMLESKMHKLICTKLEETYQ
jgi:hypothetical protein